MTDPSYYDLSQITPEIYIGPQYFRVGKGRLERLGISYSINMQVEFDSASFGLALEQHCYLPTEDDEAPGIDQLRRGIDFIRKAIGTRSARCYDDVFAWLSPDRPLLRVPHRSWALGGRP